MWEKSDCVKEIVWELTKNLLEALWGSEQIRHVRVREFTWDVRVVVDFEFFFVKKLIFFVWGFDLEFTDRNKIDLNRLLHKMKGTYYMRW